MQPLSFKSFREAIFKGSIHPSHPSDRLKDVALQRKLNSSLIVAPQNFTQSSLREKHCMLQRSRNKANVTSQFTKGRSLNDEDKSMMQTQSAEKCQLNHVDSQSSSRAFIETNKLGVLKRSKSDFKSSLNPEQFRFKVSQQVLERTKSQAQQSALLYRKQALRVASKNNRLIQQINSLQNESLKANLERDRAIQQNASLSSAKKRLQLQVTKLRQQFRISVQKGLERQRNVVVHQAATSMQRDKLRTEEIERLREEVQVKDARISLLESRNVLLSQEIQAMCDFRHRAIHLQQQNAELRQCLYSLQARLKSFQ